MMYGLIRDHGNDWSSGLWIWTTYFFEHVHDIFHVSMLRNYEPHPSCRIKTFWVQIDDQVSYEEARTQIFDWRDKQVPSKLIPLAMVLLKHHKGDEAASELETEMFDN